MTSIGERDLLLISRGKQFSLKCEHLDEVVQKVTNFLPLQVEREM